MSREKEEVIVMLKKLKIVDKSSTLSQLRSDYPEELVEDVLSLSGITSDGRIFEIGCGPGNATVSFARRGYRILGMCSKAR